MTTGEAILRFLDQQYIAIDNNVEKFVDGFAILFGRGEEMGLATVHVSNPGSLKIYRSKNEQGAAGLALNFASRHKRRKIIACGINSELKTESLIQLAANATQNHIPLFFLVTDKREGNESCPASIAFQAVCNYWKRVNRSDRLMTALLDAMSVLTSPTRTGAVYIALDRDFSEKAWDIPKAFLEKRVHRIPRPLPPVKELQKAAELITASRLPFLVVGGGANYSEAGKTVEDFSSRFHIPLGETTAGTNTVRPAHTLNLGVIGSRNFTAATQLAKESDLLIGVGTRIHDHGHHISRTNSNILTIGIYPPKGDRDNWQVTGDAKTVIYSLSLFLEKINYRTHWGNLPVLARAEWAEASKNAFSPRHGVIHPVFSSPPDNVIATGRKAKANSKLKTDNASNTLIPYGKTYDEAFSHSLSRAQSDYSTG
jgi:3D-(3,5/4)-trihydroxycyclohexane-1,2-dione acylhydrolase (decyclizing)